MNRLNDIIENIYDDEDFSSVMKTLNKISSRMSSYDERNKRLLYFVDDHYDLLEDAIKSLRRLEKKLKLNKGNINA